MAASARNHHHLRGRDEGSEGAKDELLDHSQEPWGSENALFFNASSTAAPGSRKRCEYGEFTVRTQPRRAAFCLIHRSGAVARQLAAALEGLTQRFSLLAFGHDHPTVKTPNLLVDHTKAVERLAQPPVIVRLGCFRHPIKHLNDIGRNARMICQLFAREPVMAQIVC